MSVIVVVLISDIETLGLIVDTFKLEGPFWEMIGSPQRQFRRAWLCIIGVFALSWLVSVLVYGVKRDDASDVEARA